MSVDFTDTLKLIEDIQSYLDWLEKQKERTKKIKKLKNNLLLKKL